MRCENNATDSACTRSLTPSLDPLPPRFYFKILPPFLPPGELHVKLALCADACIDALIKAAKDKRPTPTVAFLCTPTDIHVVPPEVSKAAKKNGSFLHCPGWLFLKAIQFLSRKSLVPNGLAPVPTEKGKEPLYLCDGLSAAQGLNHALAKRMQHWRAQVAYDGGATCRPWWRLHGDGQRHPQQDLRGPTAACLSSSSRSSSRKPPTLSCRRHDPRRARPEQP